MSRRDLNWIRRRTTVEDLLDDGIENNSDLSQPTTDSAPTERPVDPAFLQKRSETLAQAKREQATQFGSVRRRSVSFLGILLGALIAAGGLSVVVFPVDMRVEHRRIRHLPSVWEHITPARSRLYGSVVFAFGVALLAYSLHRPRQE